MAVRKYPLPPRTANPVRQLDAELLLTKMSLDVARRCGDWAVEQRQVSHLNGLLDRRVVLTRTRPAA